MQSIAIEHEVFPTDAGMNRTPAGSSRAINGVPHGRGDEPDYTDGFICDT